MWRRVADGDTRGCREGVCVRVIHKLRRRPERQPTPEAAGRGSCPPWRGDQHPPGSAPLGRRTLPDLADRLPPTDRPLRTLRPAVHRIPHSRHHAHLLQEAGHVRQALSTTPTSSRSPTGYTRSRDVTSCDQPMTAHSHTPSPVSAHSGSTTL